MFGCNRVSCISAWIQRYGRLMGCAGYDGVSFDDFMLLAERCGGEEDGNGRVDEGSFFWPKLPYARNDLWRFFFLSSLYPPLNACLDAFVEEE